jgi:hypothetical protein
MEKAKVWVLAILITTGLAWALFSQLPPLRQKAATVAKTVDAPPIDAPTATTMRATQTDSPPLTMEQLRAECVAEVRSAGKPSGSASTACARYEAAAAQGGDTSINIADTPAYRYDSPQTRPQTRRDQRVRPTLVAYECANHSYGSIAFRNCRAAEKKRLMEACRRGKQSAERAQGEPRAASWPLAVANCRVAELYEIIK